jgi:hypothetical protein
MLSLNQVRSAARSCGPYLLLVARGQRARLEAMKWTPEHGTAWTSRWTRLFRDGDV